MRDCEYDHLTMIMITAVRSGWALLLLLIMQFLLVFVNL